MPYAGQNMNAFKKSDIPDPVETGQCSLADDTFMFV